MTEDIKIVDNAKEFHDSRQVFELVFKPDPDTIHWNEECGEYLARINDENCEADEHEFNDLLRGWEAGRKFTKQLVGWVLWQDGYPIFTASRKAARDWMKLGGVEPVFRDVCGVSEAMPDNGRGPVS